MLIYQLHPTVESLQDFVLLLPIRHQLDPIVIMLAQCFLLVRSHLLIPILLLCSFNDILACVQVTFAASNQRVLLFLCEDEGFGPAIRVRLKHSIELNTAESEEFRAGLRAYE